MAIAAALASACDSPPPPLDVTNPPGTFISGFLDFGEVPLGTVMAEPVNFEPGRGLPSPAVVHLDIEDVAGDTNSEPSEFSVSLDGGPLTAPCVVSVTFKPDHVAAQNHALLAFWFIGADGGILDRSGYVLRGTSLPEAAPDGGADGGADGG